MNYNMDCNDFLNKFPEETYDGIFLDPPDNLGLEYDGFIDKFPLGTYIPWLSSLILKAMKHAPVVWCSYYHKRTMPLMATLNFWISKSAWQHRTFIWHYEFGQYRSTDCANNYRPILRLSRPDVVWSTDSIRIESERMRLGDARACGPRVPGDVWAFPRITCGVERRSHVPTQHPEKLMERIFLMTPGSRFLDLFGGSGTSGIVCRRLGYSCDLVEISKTYFDRLPK